MTNLLRLTRIDDLTRGDHYFLDANDDCYFIWEYKRGAGFRGKANSLIYNLKKKPSQTKNQAILNHKLNAITECSKTLSEILNPDFIAIATFVPIPCSKHTSDPEYDHRMEQICRSINGANDVRCLVSQNKTTKASHNSEQGNRISIEELMEVYEIDQSLISPTPTTIVIVDDVLTTGTHFKAMKKILSQQFPQARILGFFITRRVI
ncbi:hypothetical protein [Bartonella tamiae]|uniref:hypothetical protein n=1 Tax=Bartonella tamiae TaxID=373638 RepID=UPI000687EDFD|nr:hypothetical protein [Bartonella tamiae]